MGSDHTLFAKVTGKVAFERRGRFLRQISIYPPEPAQEQAQ
jgi:large subunit ribosomal protein L27